MVRDICVFFRYIATGMNLYFIVLIVTVVIFAGAIVNMFMFRRISQKARVKEGMQSRSLASIVDDRIVEYVKSHSPTAIEKFSQQSTMDGEKYTVIEKLPNSKQAANILSEVNRRNMILIDYLKRNYPDKEITKRLASRYKRSSIKEVNPNNLLGDTSYMVGKGRVYGLCIRQKEKGAEFVPIDDIMFVNIHELAHIATKENGHPKQFWENNEWLLKQASKIGIIELKNYGETPAPYCGIMLTDVIGH